MRCVAILPPDTKTAMMKSYSKVIISLTITKKRFRISWNIASGGLPCYSKVSEYPRWKQMCIFKLKRFYCKNWKKSHKSELRLQWLTRINTVINTYFKFEGTFKAKPLAGKLNKSRLSTALVIVNEDAWNTSFVMSSAIPTRGSTFRESSQRVTIVHIRLAFPSLTSLCGVTCASWPPFWTVSSLVSIGALIHLYFPKGTVHSLWHTAGIQRNTKGKQWCKFTVGNWVIQ